MQLIQRCALLALLGVTTVCGPEVAQESTWMLGTFSSSGVNMRNLSGIAHYEFREDGTLIFSGIAHYGEVEIEPVEYTWERLGPDLIEVHLPEPYGAVDRWRFSPGKQCDYIRISRYAGENEPSDSSLHRGKVCLGPAGGPCPSGSNCDSTITVWCDEPPPPCDDEEAP